MPEEDLLQFRVKPKRKKRQRSVIKGLIHLNIGFYLIVPILLGVFVGYRLDLWFDTKPFFVLLFIVLGLISSFYNLWKLVREEKNATTY